MEKHFTGAMTSRLPQKRYFRQRAHSNPFADHKLEYPLNPEHVDWSSHFEHNPKTIDFVDVGCGYGGLLIELAKVFPEKHILGIELRQKVADYVDTRIKALRQNHPSEYQNISVMRNNAMKFLPNFFRKGEISKLFFLFPDPHFKKKKHKARIITMQLLSEYAYLLKEGGIIYTATDVEDLHLWMVQHLDSHPLFERRKELEDDSDVVVRCVMEGTEEGKKVSRNQGQKFLAIYQRILSESELNDVKVFE